MSDILHHASTVLFLLLGVVALWRWRRHRVPSAAWAAAMFGVLALVVLAGLVLPAELTGLAGLIATKVTLVLLFLFPWCLARFLRSLSGPHRVRDRLADVLTVLIIVASLLVPNLPAEDEPRPGWFGLFLLGLIAQWTTITMLVAIGLWRDARHESTPVRRRMHLLGAGSAGLSVAILLSGVGSETAASAVQALAVLSGVMFLVGLSPPRWLRIVWREPELQAYRETVIDLMAEGSSEAIVDIALPQIARLVRGTAAVMTDKTGALIGAYGDIGDGLTYADPDVVSVEFGGGRVAVRSSRYAPYLLEDDRTLLEYFATVVHAGIERARLAQAAKEARAALEVSNKELEAFSYSVSHDLRAPLRAIHGFSTAVLEDEGDHLDENSVEFLGRIAAEAKRMDNLVDAMLGLARVTRSPMRHEIVDLSAMASEVVATLRAGDPGRAVTVEIEPGLRADGDPVLLRLVLQNLFDNAWKFTAGRDDPTIRFTGTRDGRMGRFVISDNGAGFDMTFAEKLFGAFQRLHQDDAFVGTGVGLATVQRIVHRHGGEVWADSTAGEGATFGFTMPVSISSPAHAEMGSA